MRTKVRHPARGAALPRDAGRATLLDRLLPTWDATRIERRVIEGPVDVVYSEAIHVDFLDAVRHHRLVKALFALRAGAERVVSALRFRKHESPPPPTALRLIDLPRTGSWVHLGENPPGEIVFGAIGRFWSGETRWAPIDAQQFPAFDMPGFARIGCNLVVRGLSPGRTQITYEARTASTSAEARRAFRRYWFAVSPFVGIVMRATLAEIAHNVRERLHQEPESGAPEPSLRTDGVGGSPPA